MIRTVLAIASVSFLSGFAHAQVARFDNMTPGVYGGSFVDPASGILFRSPTTPSEVDTLVIQASEAIPQRPNTSPGNYLSANVFDVEPGSGLYIEFGFTAQLPGPVDRVEFDAIHSLGSAAPSGTFLVSFREVSGGFIPSQTVTILNGGLSETHFASSIRPTKDIIGFTVTPRNLYIGYDNVLVPEPSSLAVLLPLSVVRRRR